MQTFKTFLAESSRSDKYEKDVSYYIDGMDGINSESPQASTT